MMSDDIKIEVFIKDKDPQNYCAVVLGWNEAVGSWYNTGVVVRAKRAVTAFSKAMTRVEVHG